MKKLLSLVVLLAFILPTAVHAQESTLSAEMEVQVEYTLPYPGLLPDSPLYPLKVIRDKIVSFLISDSLKKAEYNLLQSDKRLQSGVYLLNKGKEKEKIAIDTISKGENYFHQAIVEIEKAKQQKLMVNDTLSKMTDASKKHHEVLLALTERLDGAGKNSIEKELRRVAGFQKELSQLSEE